MCVHLKSSVLTPPLNDVSSFNHDTEHYLFVMLDVATEKRYETLD